MMQMHVSYDVFYNMPVKIRRWFIDRLIKYRTPASDNIADNMDVPLSSLYRDK